MQANEIEGLISEMTQRIQARLETHRVDNPVMIGIHTGGVWLASQLHQRLAIKEPLGTLDISFYRDDFTRIGINPEVKPSQIPFDVDERHIILVDDVLQTGRTIRAAMNEIFDYGRPASITLVTLVERGGRELPIQPSVVGIRPPLGQGQQITLTGPDPLTLIISTATKSDKKRLRQEGE